MKLEPQYLVNASGQRTGVLLTPQDFERIIEALEDQFDAAELDDLVQHETEFFSYDQVREELRAEGKL